MVQLDCKIKVKKTNLIARDIIKTKIYGVMAFWPKMN